MPQFVVSGSSGWIVAFALLVGGFGLFVTGKLRINQKEDGRDELIAFYRDAWHDERAAHAETRKQLGESMELGRTSVHVLTAAAKVAGAGTVEGDGENAPTMA